MSKLYSVVCIYADYNTFRQAFGSAVKKQTTYNTSSPGVVQTDSLSVDGSSSTSAHANRPRVVMSESLSPS